VTPGPRPGFVVSCEHAGNLVPAPWRPLFAGAGETLRSHRGWDPGAARIARALASALAIEPILHHPTRLLADANRSADHPQCFSEFTRELDDADRATILTRYHRPYRTRVQRAVREAVETHGTCVHVSVHTFTPVLDGVERDVDVGLLFDPVRHLETELIEAWRTRILAGDAGIRVRRNDPYLGTDDGLTTTLRTIHPADRYAGIEIEVNQAHASSLLGRRITTGLVAAIVEPVRRRARG